jgi:hypothetical protein
MSKKSEKLAERAQACTDLRKMLKPGMTVHTILRHCSRSGMMRHISLLVSVPAQVDVYAKNPDGSTNYDAKPRRKRAGCEMRDISYLAAGAMDLRLADDGGIKIGGCGMDMGFDLVYRLGATLWPKGTRKPHGTRNGEPDSAGGYALKQRWM